jgi:hypothetical protein
MNVECLHRDNLPPVNVPNLLPLYERYYHTKFSEVRIHLSLYEMCQRVPQRPCRRPRVGNIIFRAIDKPLPPARWCSDLTPVEKAYYFYFWRRHDYVSDWAYTRFTVMGWLYSNPTLALSEYGKNVMIPLVRYGGHHIAHAGSTILHVTPRRILPSRMHLQAICTYTDYLASVGNTDELDKLRSSIAPTEPVDLTLSDSVTAGPQTGEP